LQHPYLSPFGFHFDIRNFFRNHSLSVGWRSQEAEGKKSDDCLEIIQAEAHTSKERRGRAKGFEERNESGRALGFAEGQERGRESAARAHATEIASLSRDTDDALFKRLCDILEHSVVT
jgi:flagellar biosynthesis/type III secretory pathway protein FliH